MSKVIGQRLKWKFPQGLYRHPGFIFSDGSPVSKRFQIVAVPFMASLGVNDRVSIQDVFFSVQALEELQIGDDLPCIGANSLPLQCRSSFDTNFEDRSAFITGCSKFIEEATKHAEFDELLREGFAHAANLYTWRCCSRAVPMPRSNDQPNRAEINEKIMQVLEPEVRKLDNFMQFTLTTVDRFCGEFRLLCHPEKRNDFVSESLLLLLGKLLNMFLVLDALKDMKASTKNDLSTFRRASQFASHNSHTLSLFLANQNSIKQLLRKEIQKMDGHEELLADMINISAHFYENKMYISPDQRHSHIKVIAFCLYLMDLEVYTRLDQKKRISIQKLDKIFNSIEVVPLFGDMNILPFSFVKQCRNARQCGPNGQCKCYDSAKWPLSNNESERCHVDIVQRLPHIREQHDDFVTNLSRIRNEISVYNRVGPSNDGENREMANLVLSGLQLLCGWTCDVVETVAWKLLNPTNQRRNADCPDNAETYELATKYNYTGHEKAAIIEEAVQRGYEAAMDELQTVGIDATYARFDMCMPPHFVRADGPSYTAAVVAAILSLFMQRRVRADSAVTGDVGRAGRVRRIGNIHKKVPGAVRAGMSQIILPTGNRKDFDKIPLVLKQQITPIYIGSIWTMLV